MRKWAVRLCILQLLTAGTLLAQKTYSKGEVEDGANFFRSYCARCHGPDGDSVPGVDLGHGKFRHASSDKDLVQIILVGIPGTGMPENDDLGRYDAEAIVAYMRYMAATAQSVSSPGDPVRGKAIFEGVGGCLNCHRVKDRGSRLGPDLTDVGAIRRAVELKRSLLEPNAQILPQNRFYRVVTRDGVTITGRLLNHDTFSVQLIDSKQRLLSFQKSSLKQYGFVEGSPMPSYRGKLNSQELEDLVSYLVTLKGIKSQ